MVSGLGPGNGVGGFFLALTDNGSLDSLVLTEEAGGYSPWIAGFAVGSEDGLDDTADKGKLARGL